MKWLECLHQREFKTILATERDTQLFFIAFSKLALVKVVVVKVKVVKLLNEQNRQKVFAM